MKYSTRLSLGAQCQASHSETKNEWGDQVSSLELEMEPQPPPIIQETCMLLGPTPVLAGIIVILVVGIDIYVLS